MQIEPLASWVPGYEKPLVIAGPCSVESEAQFSETLGRLPLDHIHFVRGGIWKPRTRPGNFEGHGPDAFEWVNASRKTQPFRFATEVATPEHIEQALAEGVELLWIGARTTVNPFHVQQLADTLKGKDVAVFVKNPINPDLALWKGAIERFAAADITRLGAIHRGFHSHQPSRFRNPPIWQIPLELKSTWPDLPLICDPSHIGGDASMIQEIAQRALDLDYDGLMIESHCNPPMALSDAKQQVSPEGLAEILSTLELRASTFSDVLLKDELAQIRQQIDQADKDILDAIASRMDLVERIGTYKKENNVAIFQISRWKEVFRSRQDWGQALELDQEFIKNLYRLIHQQSVKKQTGIFNTQDKELDSES